MSLITPFDPWRNNLCSCPPKLSLAAYTGCGGGCLYCYASSYIRNFAAPRPKKDFLKKLAREIKKVPAGSIITMANSSDPYQPLEKELKLTRKALGILKDFPVRLNIVTKSALILRDLDILRDFKKIVVSISICTLEEKLAPKLEPNASSPRERLGAAKELSRHLAVAVRLDPLIYPLTTEKIAESVKKIKQAGAGQVITSTYKHKPDSFKRMITAFPEFKKIWSELYLKQGKRRGNYAYLPQNLRKELIDKVRTIARQENIKFSACREGFKSLNTAACDGSALFSATPSASTQSS